MQVFVKNSKTPKMEIFAFCVITLEPIRFQTYQAHQNDLLNLSFVKGKHAVGKKWPETAVKQPFIIVILFDSDYIWLDKCEESQTDNDYKPNGFKMFLELYIQILEIYCFNKSLVRHKTTYFCFLTSSAVPSPNVYHVEGIDTT